MTHASNPQHPLPADVIDILETYRSKLGPAREACSESGKLMWDRIDIALKGQGGDPAARTSIQEAPATPVQQEIAEIEDALEGASACEWGDAKSWTRVTGDEAEGRFLAAISPAVLGRILAHFKILDAQLEPMSSAPRDGTPVLLRFRDKLDARVQNFQGLAFVGRNRNDLSEWCFAAPVGMAGLPDDWFVGWMRLPAPLQVANARTGAAA